MHIWWKNPDVQSQLSVLGMLSTSLVTIHLILDHNPEVFIGVQVWWSFTHTLIDQLCGMEHCPAQSWGTLSEQKAAGFLPGSPCTCPEASSDHHDPPPNFTVGERHYGLQASNHQTTRCWTKLEIRPIRDEDFIPVLDGTILLVSLALFCYSALQPSHLPSFLQVSGCHPTSADLLTLFL